MTLWFEDMRVGDRRYTGDRTLTEEDVDAFAHVSGDHNPLHTDDAHAAGFGFPGRVGHGLLGLAVLTGLLDRAGWFDRSAVAMLGIEEWRLLAPLTPGCMLRVEMVIVAARPARRPDVGVVDRRFRLLDVSPPSGREPATAQEGRIPFLMSRRPAPSPALSRQREEPGCSAT